MQSDNYISAAQLTVFVCVSKLAQLTGVQFSGGALSEIFFRLAADAAAVLLVLVIQKLVPAQRKDLTAPAAAAVALLCAYAAVCAQLYKQISSTQLSRGAVLLSLLLLVALCWYALGSNISAAARAALPVLIATVFAAVLMICGAYRPRFLSLTFSGFTVGEFGKHMLNSAPEVVAAVILSSRVRGKSSATATIAAAFAAAWAIFIPTAAVAAACTGQCLYSEYRLLALFSRCTSLPLFKDFSNIFFCTAVMLGGIRLLLLTQAAATCCRGNTKALRVTTFLLAPVALAALLPNGSLENVLAIACAAATVLFLLTGGLKEAK